MMRRFNRTQAIVAWLALAAGSAASHAQPPPADAPAGDAVRGQVVYQACQACHSIDEDDVGPRHRGVLGRTAGGVPGYAYSEALRHSGIIWTPANLDRWLTNPQSMVPGTKMFFAMSNAQDRADVIAFLAGLR